MSAGAVGMRMISVMANDAASEVTYPTAQEIAQELTSTNSLVHMFVLADSRISSYQSEWMTDITAIKWGGVEPSLFTGIGNAAHAITTKSPALAPVASTAVAGNISAYTPHRAIDVIFNGTTEPNAPTSATITRISSAPVSAASYPLLHARFAAGGDVRARALIARHPDAMSANPGVRMSWLVNGLAYANAGNAQSAYVDDLTGTGFAELSVTLEDGYDWATYTAPGIDLVAEANAPTVSGECLLLLTPWIQAESGIVLHNWAVGGRTLTHFRTEDIFSNALFQQLIPIYGGKSALLIDLGTNGTFGVGEAEHKALLDDQIADFREADPDGWVIFLTSYPTYGGKTDPLNVLAAKTVASETEGVLLLDTWRELPDVDDAVALGFMTPTQSYTANGAQSAGAMTFVVNQTISGIPASGAFYVFTSNGYQERVNYSSFAASTFTISDVGGLPASVANGAPAHEGDIVHYTATGRTAWRRRLNYSVLEAAGATQSDAVSVSADDAGAVTSGGFFDSIPNAGTLGGTFTASSTNRPALGAQNGLACMTFDNTDYLVSSLAASTYTSMHDGTGYWTFSFYIKPTVTTTLVLFSTFTGSALARGIKIGMEASGAISLQIGNGSGTFALSKISAAGALTVGAEHVLQLRVEGRYYRVLVDGVTVLTGVSASPSVTAPLHTLTIGYQGSFSWRGTITQLDVQSAALSTAEMAAIQNAMVAKWAAV